jgi:hypothetical protein
MATLAIMSRCVPVVSPAPAHRLPFQEDHPLVGEAVRGAPLGAFLPHVHHFGAVITEEDSGVGTERPAATL